MKNPFLQSNVCIVLCLVLLVSVSGQSRDIIYADSLTVQSTQSSGFTVSPLSTDSRIDYVEIDFHYFPVESHHQHVVSTQTSPQARQDDDAVVFRWESPAFGSYDYEVVSQLETQNAFVHIDEKIPFPMDVPEEVEIYTQPTPLIDIDDDIIRQASTLAEGEDDLYSVVYNLATWTKSNINYSLTTVTADASQKASWVLENRYGVCDELTNVFIAMSRSLGIPARFVSGIAYTDSELFTENWGLHGWAEVYFPGHGWVSFDPTYGQYGYVDAAHIKLRDSLDSNKSSSSFRWQAYQVELEPQPFSTDIDVLQTGNKINNPVSMEFEILGDKVEIGSYNLIEVTVQNQEDYYVGLEYMINKPVEVHLIDGRKRYLALGPGEEKSVYWVVQVDEELDDKYIYTFPMEVSHSLGYSESSEFKAEKDSIDYSRTQIEQLVETYREAQHKTVTGKIDVSCPRITSYAGEEVEIGCIIANAGNAFLDSLRVCLEDDCKRMDLGISQEKTARFTRQVSEEGTQTLQLTVRNADVYAVEVVEMEVLDVPNITLEVDAPSPVSYGPEFEISFEALKQSRSSPKNVSVLFTFNELEKTWKLEELDANQAFRVRLDKTALRRTNDFTVDILYHDGLGRQHSRHAQGTVDVANVGFLQSIEMWLNSLSRKIEQFFKTKL